MARVLYFDAFSGISGDMILGAFLDAGLPLDSLQQALGSLALDGCTIAAEKVLRAGLSATQFVVTTSGPASEMRPPASEVRPPASETSASGTWRPASETWRPASAGRHEHTHVDAQGRTYTHAHGHDSEQPHDHPHRSLPDIFALIDGSALSTTARSRAKALFRRLAEVEAAIHQMPVDEVHLHEVGALDSIVDIVGAVFALEWARVDRIECSPLNVGGGMVESAHGLIPVPAPATLALLGGAPVYSGRVQKELVTPTGALIATSYADAFGPLPSMSIERVGYGAGSRDNPGTPNVLRVVIGRSDERPAGDRVTVIECEIDDMNPQLFGSTMERLYAAGALEVFYVPVQMKKNRPGTLLTVVSRPELRSTLADVIFRETTTIGLRHYEVERECLEREIITVDMSLGQVRFKLARRDGRVINAVPEFEDCAALARAHDMSVKDVQALAIQAYGGRASAPPTAL